MTKAKVMEVLGDPGLGLVAHADDKITHPGWSSRVRMDVTGNLEKTGLRRGWDTSLRVAGLCMGSEHLF